MTRPRFDQQLEPLAVGDEVRLFDINRRHEAGGSPGEVIRVGRKLFTVRCRLGDVDFRLEDRCSNDGFRHQWVLTLGEVAAMHRREVAVELLDAAGIRVDRGCPLTLDQLEALAAALPKEGRR